MEFSKKKKSFIKKKNPRRNVLQRKFFQEKEFLRKIFCKYFSKKGIFKKKKIQIKIKKKKLKQKKRKKKLCFMGVRETLWKNDVVEF